jgi:hypothetical protein
MAAFVRRAGDPREALRLASTAADDLGQVLGSDHPHALAAQMNVAICEFDVRETERALSRMADAARRLARVLGADHPHTLRCEANLSLIKCAVHGPGVPGPEPIIDRLASRLGDDHPAVAALRDGRLLRRVIDPHPF